jgi:tRNA U34 5-methylaminomethyl-2-thiouridine-forming methyltransferase MnmC
MISTLKLDRIRKELKNGSPVFFSEKYGEYYKSTTGAEEEAIKKFVEPAMVAEKAKSGKISILDVCFGLGHNSAAAIDVAFNSNPNCEITIFGLEYDLGILSEIQEISLNFKSYGLIKELINRKDLQITKKYGQGLVDMKILVGDAMDTIRAVKLKFDVIFLDPFSPKKCPELWTEEFFNDIKALAKPGAILTTYSCARSVRDNLKKAGFEVKDGPCVSRRGPSTVAILTK